jgi:hypothetical protein
MARNTRQHGADSATIQEEGGPLDTPEETSPGNGADDSADQHTDGATSMTSVVFRERKPKKTDEEKNIAWTRLANNRTTDALKAMLLLGHLTNTSQYIWTEAQERKLISALRGQLDALEESFAVSRAAYESGAKRKGAKQLLLNLAT